MQDAARETYIEEISDESHNLTKLLMSGAATDDQDVIDSTAIITRLQAVLKSTDTLSQHVVRSIVKQLNTWQQFLVFSAVHQGV